ncbi:MAG: endolytic transglycosylase MltG [Candidatus Yanofskybacteria bacterium]|nr:endolytic transglycosylase MltG [Candidatus Yanofskybacteria bacterium]
MGRNLTKYNRQIILIVIAVLVLGAALVITPHRRDNSPESQEFIIESGQPLSVVARSLEERNIIYSHRIFSAYAVFSGNEKKFKAGRYLIPPSVSVRELVGIFSDGRSELGDIKITIPEGTNVADIGRILSETLAISGSFLKPEIISLEGELFPDTYYFKKLSLDERLPVDEIVKKMRDNFELKTEDIFSRTGEGVAEKGYRALIVASILEKEVQTREDMRLVAGIIERRLDLGMPLQIDATVAYGVCHREFLRGRYCNVSQANIVDNLKVDSEYNTYARTGLPLRPITNPGIRAIEAALDPKPSEYLYYLNARDGTTIFSKTAAEHEMNRRKYLQN